MIPLKINGKMLCEIFHPQVDFSSFTDDQKSQYCIDHLMQPTEVILTSETYSRDAERTADYELMELLIVNRKAKPEFVWRMLKTEYVSELLRELKYAYDFVDNRGIVTPKLSEDILITYQDFTGERTIKAYLGQTLEGTLVEYEGVTYWENFRIAFPEK